LPLQGAVFGFMGFLVAMYVEGTLGGLEDYHLSRTAFHYGATWAAPLGACVAAAHGIFLRYKRPWSALGYAGAALVSGTIYWLFSQNLNILGSWMMDAIFVLSHVAAMLLALSIQR
jgi:hypothetical protein